MIFIYFLFVCVVVLFSIDSSSRNIRVPENNETVEVCVSRVGDTVQTYTVTLESKLNSGGNMATGMMQYYS